MKKGYGIELRGQFYFEATFSDGLFLRTPYYPTQQALHKALPFLCRSGASLKNIRPFDYKGRHFFGIYDAGNRRLAFTIIDRINGSAEKKDRYRRRLADFFSHEAAAADLDLALLRDESRDAIYIDSVVGLLAEIEKIPQEKGHIFYFRGHSSYLYKMEPGIYRKPELINNEDIIFKEISIRCPADFSNITSTFDMLVKMQHYSCPTRLLDLTTNPLVALYFACEERISKNGLAEVKLLSIPTDEIKYYDSDTVSLLSNLALQSGEFNLDCLSDPSDKQYIHYLDDIKREKPHFTPRITPASAGAVVCVKPKLDNARIMRQDGAFLLFGINGNKKRPPEVPKKYSSALGKKRFLIIESVRENIVQQLERVGISAATIYPEIDKVSSFISAKYGKPEEPEDEKTGMIKDMDSDAG